MNITLTPAQLAFIDAIRTYGPAMGLDITQEKYTRESMRQVALKFKGNKRIPDWIARDLARRGERGIFLIPEVAAPAQAPEATEEATDATAAPVAEALESVREMASAI